jgi:hypothetical protein
MEIADMKVSYQFFHLAHGSIRGKFFWGRLLNVKTRHSMPPINACFIAGKAFWTTPPSPLSAHYHYAVYLRVVATVIAPAPWGLATIRISNGTTSEVVTGTTWRVGATVTCEHTARGQTAWQALDCRQTS